MSEPVALPEEPLPDRRWGDVAVVLAICLLPQLHNGLSHAVWPELAPHRPPIAYFETSTMVLMAGWLALFALLVRRSGQPAIQFRIGRPQGQDVLMAGGVLVVLYLLAGKVAGFFPDVDPLHDPTSQTFPVPPSAAIEYILCVVGCLAVGFGEEAIWRAYLIPRIEAITGSGLIAWLATSILFGLGHLYLGVHGVVNAAVIGLFLGGVFCWQRRLWGIAVGHGLYDALITVAPQ